MPDLTQEQQEARGAEAANVARRNVAEQLFTLVTESESTGSADLLAQRVDELVREARGGDVFLLRGAAMELSRAAALYAVRLDLRQGAGG